jgi:hypothetical protein
MKEERNKMTECWSCEFKQEVPGDAHIKCINPDPNMEGDPHGIKHGWFLYPLIFDPTWKMKNCSNFKEKVPAVSNAVSPEK